MSDMMMKPTVLCIDMGTTFSAAAIVNEHGIAEIIENMDGKA